jgi:hypothetical protein
VISKFTVASGLEPPCQHRAPFSQFRAPAVAPEAGYLPNRSGTTAIIPIVTGVGNRPQIECAKLANALPFRNGKLRDILSV